MGSFRFKTYTTLDSQGGIANAFDVPGVSLLLRHVIQDQVDFII
jgi:hypothetical protein